MLGNTRGLRCFQESMNALNSVYDKTKHPDRSIHQLREQNVKYVIAPIFGKIEETRSEMLLVPDAIEFPAGQE
jgi:hypothetical protein